VPFYLSTLRVARHSYSGRRIYFVTIGTERRTPFFVDQQLGRSLLDRLFAIAARQDFSLHAYCVMPGEMLARFF
jgi:REP element-mobilizing transposase RayT